MRPQPRVQNKKAHEHSHHGHTGFTRHSPRALPGDHACLTPSPALLLADLTPTLGRQNDTTWPYASALFVNCAASVHRIPPRVRDDREPPLWGTGPNRYSADFTPPSSGISENRKLNKDPRVRLERDEFRLRRAEWPLTSTGPQRPNPIQLSDERQEQRGEQRSKAR